MVLVLAGLLSGCSAPPREAAAFIAPGVRFALPGPSALGYRMNAAQIITARFRGDVQVFEAHVSVSPERLMLVGLDPFGRRALTVTLSDTGIAVDAAPWLPTGLKAENILADIAIIYWPEEAVRRALSSTNAVLRVDPGGRSILAGGQEVVRVDYASQQSEAWSGAARYRNNAFDYELDLRSVVDAP